MTTLTYLLHAEIKDARQELNGKTLTRPALLVTDGEAIVYACDVDIGIKDPAGNEQALALIDKYNTVLRNVTIARAGYDMIYADVGAAVRLRRTVSGRYEIVGFSDEMPGTYTRVPVDLNTLQIGMVEDMTLTSRSLTLLELSTYGGFGAVPLGAIAVFQGAQLLQVT